MPALGLRSAAARPAFEQIDYQANINILEEAKKQESFEKTRFIFVSAGYPRIYAAANTNHPPSHGLEFLNYSG